MLPQKGKKHLNSNLLGYPLPSCQLPSAREVGRPKQTLKPLCQRLLSGGYHSHSKNGVPWSECCCVWNTQGLGLIPEQKKKGKTKTRLWSTLLKRRIDLVVESQVTDSGAGGCEGSEGLWCVRYKKIIHPRSTHSEDVSSQII